MDELRRTLRAVSGRVAFLIFCGLMIGPVFGQTAGMLSFQGLIKDGAGIPINPPGGTIDLEFRIYDAETGGNLMDMDGDHVIEDVGCVLGDVDCRLDIPVTDGIVSTKFGPVAASSFYGGERWLEVRVDDNDDGVFETLSRVEIVTAPATAEQLNIPPTGISALIVDDNGSIGIGTQTPTATLDVTNSGGLTAVRGKSSWIGVYGSHTSTSGTFPGVWGETNSRSTGATAMRGIVTSTTPGTDSSGVFGKNSGTSSKGIGVRGTHSGSGVGVQGEAASTASGIGVKGRGYWGVSGQANDPDGYGGIFSGSGFLGGGQALLVWGDAYMAGRVGIGGIGGSFLPDAPLHIIGGADVEPDHGGVLVIGDVSGT